MTTTVTIVSHCSAEREVLVKITGTGGPDEVFTLQDGVKAERYVYDSREISVREVVKVPAQPPCDNNHVAEGCEKF